MPRIVESEELERALQLPEGTQEFWPWIVFAGLVAIVIIWDAVKSRKQTDEKTV